MQDVLDPKILRQKIEVALAEKNLWLERVYESRAVRARRRREPVRGVRAAAAAVRRRHVAASSTEALRDGQRGAVRGRAGDAARPRPRHVSVRHVVEPGRGGRGDRRRASARTRIDRVIGVAKAYVTRVGEGPFPSEIDGPDQDARARARRRVRHGDGAEPALRLARPRRAPLRGARQRHRPARAHEARRPLALRRAARVRALRGCPTAPRARTSRRTRATSTQRSRCTRRCPAGRSRSTTCVVRRRPADAAARATSSSSSGSSTSRSTLIGTGAERESVLTRA